MRKILFATVLGLSMVFASATFALGASLNPVAESIANPASSPDAYVKPADELKANLATDDTQFDGIEGDPLGAPLNNVNQSGVNVGLPGAHPEVIKSQGMTNPDGTTGTQRTHGEYQNNTNSCASCHQTHTAAAQNLLFKSSVYDTCTACHDGTLGFYNVFSESSAGTFAGTVGGNASMHLPNAAIEVKAAPGGNRQSSDPEGEGWSAEFTCASCHAPHGSYSDRLLAYNPNNIANTPVSEGGLQVTALGTQVVTNMTNATDDVVLYQVTSSDNTNYPAGATGNALVVMKKSGSSYVRDKNPWMAGSEHGQPAFTRFEGLSNVKINYAQGYAYGADFSTATKIVIARAIVVKFNETTAIDTDSKVSVAKVLATSYENNAIGAQITQFCAACHTDYSAQSGSPTGIWTKAFRHSTGNYNCLKCHYAHGTDVTVMLDANDNTVTSLTEAMGSSDAAKAYMLDKNPSSALKRYTNMSVCWKCHTKSHSTDLINNVWVQGSKTNSETTEYNTPNPSNLPVSDPANTSMPYGFTQPTVQPWED